MLPDSDEDHAIVPAMQRFLGELAHTMAEGIIVAITDHERRDEELRLERRTARRLRRATQARVVIGAEPVTAIPFEGQRVSDKILAHAVELLEVNDDMTVTGVAATLGIPASLLHRELVRYRMRYLSWCNQMDDAPSL